MQHTPPDPSSELDDLAAQLDSFDPEEFISDLVGLSLAKAEESRQQYAALAAAQGSASDGPVDVRVGPSGELLALAFVEEPRGWAADTLSEHLITAYRKAAALANEQVARSTPGEVADAVRQSAPEAIEAARPLPDEDFGAGPSTSGSALPSHPTVADLPADDALDELLALLDDDDPFRALERLRAHPGVTAVDATLSGPDLDAQVRAEVEAITERGAALGPELAAIAVRDENADARVTVNAWGGLSAIELTASSRSRSAQALADSVLELVRRATSSAASQAHDLLTGAGLATGDDPVLGQLDSRIDQQTISERQAER